MQAGKSATPGKVVYTSVFKDLTQPQKLMLEENGDGDLDRLLVRIDLNSDGSADTPGQVYAKTRSLLVSRLGSPSRVYGENSPTTSTVFDIASGRYPTVLEWQDKGSLIRYSVPEVTNNRFYLEVEEVAAYAYTGPFVAAR